MDRVTLLESFENGYVAEPNSGCWLWTRSLNNKGYGKLSGIGNGRWMLAHRFGYEQLHGPIPVGLVLDHKCRTPSCVNPDHLEAVTQRVNSRRGSLAHIERTGFCARSHVVTRRNARGNLYCQACNTLWHRQKNAK